MSRDYRDPYPRIDPYRTGRLKVSDLHDLYFEECGNPDGKPVVMLHGGPGGGCNDFMRRLHDPSAYRIILFDQRGCGRSTPYASLEDNTTWHLVSDIEALREHLGIDSWQVLGIAGAMLDVFHEEPLPPSSPLWETPNLFVSPHMSGDYTNYKADVAKQFLENLRRYRAGEELFNVVDKKLGFVAS